MPTLVDKRQLVEVELVMHQMLANRRAQSLATLIPTTPRLSLRNYIHEAWTVVEPATRYKSNWHIDVVSDHLEAVSRGQIRNLVINLPPRHMKSLAVSVFWPTWSWTLEPHLRWMYASYAESLSVRDALKSRRVIQSPWYQHQWGSIVHLTGDQNVKCLAMGTEVLMANGSQVAIEHVRVGDRILSVDDEGHCVVDTVKHWVPTGEKPVRKLTLSDGTVIRATPEHRLFGWDRWVQVRDLRIGDPLTVIEKVPEQHGNLSSDDAFLLALWLAEGTKSNCSFHVTTADELIVGRLASIASRRGWDIRQTGGGKGFTVSARRCSVGDTPRNVLRRAGIVLRRQNKELGWRTETVRVPLSVFAAPTPVVAEFIGTYIASDGSVIHAKNHGVQFSSSSEDMVRDLALLLKRLAVKASISVDYNHTYVVDGIRRPAKDAWVLKIMDSAEVMKLAQVPVYAKTDRLASLVDFCRTPMRHHGGRSASVPPVWRDGLDGPRYKAPAHSWASRVAVRRFAEANGLDALVARMDGDLDWRRVVAIEDEGPVATYDIETARQHRFFANGVLSHNSRYENTATGYRIATSVGGSATGEGADVIVADDCHKVAEAESQLERETVLTWWDETMSTRLNDPNTGRKVIVMQRLAEQDLTGYVLERGNYHHLMLPAEYEPSVTIDMGACSAGIPHEPVRTVEGELLWPAQFDADALTNLKIELGPYAASGQLQQSPVPRAGMLLDPADFGQTPVPLEPSTVDVIASIDLNYSSSETSDWTVAMLGAVDRGGVFSKIHIVDVLREHLSDAHHEQVLGNWLCRWRPTIVGIEKRAFEKEGATMDLCRRLMEYCQARGFALSVEPITVDTDKVSRAMIIPGRSKAGMMTADKRQPWWPTLSREMTTFPRGGSAHDDQIDALSMLVRIAAEKLERVRGHKALYGHSSRIQYSEAQDPDTSDAGRLAAAGWR